MKSNKRRFVTVIVAAVFLVGLVFLITSYSKSINGTEVKDEFMEDFFRPEIKHKSVKVIETKEGKRYIVIDFGRKLEQPELNKYQITLAKHGLNEYSTGKGTPFISVEIQRKLRGESPYSSYEMLMFRDTDEEGVLEFSRNDINPPGAEIRSAVNFLSRFKTEIAIEVAPDFGRKWEKWEFNPEEEVPGVDPRIGKYPGSVRADVRDNIGGSRVILYHVQATSEKILDFYREKFERLIKLDPSLKLTEEEMSFATFQVGEHTIRPAKVETLLLGGHFHITISIYQPYFSDKLRVLEIKERIPSNEDIAFVEKESEL